MATLVIGYASAAIYGLLCIALGVILYKFGVQKKYTRKLTHILVGFEWLILYHFFGATIHTLIVCLAFTLLLFVDYFAKLLPAMSSDADNAPGTVYYGVSMSAMALISLFVPDMMLPFGIGVFCTSLGDGLAGVVGQSVKRFNPPVYLKKSLWGTLANFLISFLVSLVFRFAYDMPISVLSCLLIALLSVGLELIGVFGLDNLFITVGVALFSYGLAFHYAGVMAFSAPILLTPLVIIFAISKNALTKKGLAAALILDVAVSLTLANFGFVLLLSFLVLSVLIDKIKKKRKAVIINLEKKGDCRDEIQVIANGLIPAVLALLFAITREHMFIVAYVAALAEAFGDTAASGFGVFAKNTFDPFKMRRCKCGLSGGMSVVGTLASLVAAVIISLIALAFGVVNLYYAAVAAVSAFLGVVFDSFLGSVFQIKYRCKACGEIIEKESHCGADAERYSGFAFFDNDIVNICSGAFASIAAIVFYMFVTF